MASDSEAEEEVAEVPPQQQPAAEDPPPNIQENTIEWWVRIKKCPDLLRLSNHDAAKVNVIEGVDTIFDISVNAYLLSEGVQCSDFFKCLTQEDVATHLTQLKTFATGLRGGAAISDIRYVMLKDAFGEYTEEARLKKKKKDQELTFKKKMEQELELEEKKLERKDARQGIMQVTQAKEIIKSFRAVHVDFPPESCPTPKCQKRVAKQIQVGKQFKLRNKKPILQKIKHSCFLKTMHQVWSSSANGFTTARRAESRIAATSKIAGPERRTFPKYSPKGT